MERVTRLVVVTGAIALLAAHLVIGRAWTGMATAAVVAGLASLALQALTGRGLALVLAAGCLLPAVTWWSLETFSAQFWIIWLAALLGAMLPQLAGPSQLPGRLRLPLLMALLAVVVAAPLVILREIDFYPPLLGDMPGAVLSGLPWFSTEWTLQVAVTTLVTTFCFDWCVSVRRLDIERDAIAPLALTIAVSSLVAVYQMFVDVTALNATVYGGLGRAGGTMFDANVSGVLAAMGIGFAAFLAAGPGSRPAWLLLVPVHLLAVWASGSRTGLGAAAVVIVTCVYGWWRQARASGAVAFPLSRRAALVGIAVVLAASGVAIALSGTTTVGPLGRFARMLPGAGGQSVSAALTELWNRNGYGAAASWLIARYPLTGIGLGSFHLFGPPLTPIGTLPPDNAQNWLRHQLVEMGVLGALGWMLFAAAFAWFIVVTGRRLEPRLHYLRGVVFAFAAISLFGMPTQEPVPAVTFWIAAGVLVRLQLQPALAGATAWPPAVPLRPVAMLLVLVMTTAFGVATWQTATGRLRVPMRARQLGWPYSYGFYEPEGEPASGAERWMADRATALVDVRGPVMQLTIRSPLPGNASDPVHVTVWSEGRRAFQASLDSDAPVVTALRMPVGLTRTLLDLEVSRTVRPSDLDPATHDDRQLGALVSWTFAPR